MCALMLLGGGCSVAARTRQAAKLRPCAVNSNEGLADLPPQSLRKGLYRWKGQGVQAKKRHVNEHNAFKGSTLFLSVQGNWGKMTAGGGP